MATGASLAFVVNVLGMAIGFAAQTVLTRTLGSSEYGVYAYALGWMNIGLLAAKLEFDIIAVRFVGAYSGSGEWPRLVGFMRRAVGIVLVASLTVAGGTALWRLLRAPRPLESRDVAFLITCAIVPITALLQLFGCALQGLRRAIASLTPAVILRPILLVLLFAGSLLLAPGAPSALAALLSNLLASVLVLGAAFYFYRRALPAAARTVVQPEYDTAMWVRTSLGVLAISVAQLVLSGTTDVVVVGTLLDKAEAGRYSVASQVALLLGLPSTAILFMMNPTIAEYFHQQRSAELQQLIAKVNRASVLLALPAFLGLLLLGRFILGIFGPGFASAYPVMVILLLGGVSGAAGGAMAGYMMTMTGHQKPAAWIIGLSALVYAALAYPMTKFFGAEGTAWSTVISYQVRAIALDLFIRRRMGLRVFQFGT